jgi:TPR repeat protein
MYYTGEGIRENKTEAYKWFYIASELGNDDAKDNKELAAKGMRKSDLRKATKMATQWLKNFSDASPDL